MRLPARVVGAVLAVVAVVGLLVAANYLGLGGGQTEQAQPGPSVTAGSVSPTRVPSRTASRDPETGLPLVQLASLPQQVQQTVRLIDRGGPFPYAKDGAVFSNRERLLPSERSGYYREYTVPTPGSGDRGARRIVTGNQDRDVFYSGDHYVTFVRIQR